MSWNIYELAPYYRETLYRFIETFQTEEDAKKVLEVLESVNVLFSKYEIIEE